MTEYGRFGESKELMIPPKTRTTVGQRRCQTRTAAEIENLVDGCVLGSECKVQCSCTCVHVCVWRPENNFGCPSPRDLCHVCRDINSISVSLTSWNLASRLLSPGVCPFLAMLPSICYHAQHCFLEIILMSSHKHSALSNQCWHASLLVSPLMASQILSLSKLS